MAISVCLYTPVAHSEYHSDGISEAQGLAQVTPEHAPVSPEVMAAVVAKVRANPQLTKALVQANPRFKKILGLADNDPLLTGATPERKESLPIPKDGPLPTNANLPPSEQKLRLNETLSQVRMLLSADPREFAQTRPQQREQPQTVSDANAVASSNRRLLSSLDSQSARRDTTSPKGRRFDRYTNSAGGASLQASLEFNRSVRGAVAPGRNEQGYQLALRDISESDRDSDNGSEQRSRKAPRQDREFAARKVGGVVEYTLPRHEFSELRIGKEETHADPKNNKNNKPATDGRHSTSYESAVVKQ